MGKLHEEDLEILENYARKLRYEIDEFKMYARMINFSEEQKLINEAAIEILERKYEEMTKAKNKKALNKVIRVKKILEDGEKNNGEN